MAFLSIMEEEDKLHVCVLESMVSEYLSVFPLSFPYIRDEHMHCRVETPKCLLS